MRSQLNFVEQKNGKREWINTSEMIWPQIECHHGLPLPQDVIAYATQFEIPIDWYQTLFYMLLPYICHSFFLFLPTKAVIVVFDMMLVFFICFYNKYSRFWTKQYLWNSHLRKRKKIISYTTFHSTYITINRVSSERLYLYSNGLFSLLLSCGHFKKFSQ